MGCAKVALRCIRGAGMLYLATQPSRLEIAICEFREMFAAKPILLQDSKATGTTNLP